MSDAMIDRLQADVRMVVREQEHASATIAAAAAAYTETARRLGEQIEGLEARLDAGLEELSASNARLDRAIARLEGVVEGRALAAPHSLMSEAPKAAARAQVDVARWSAWALVLVAFITALSSLGAAWLASWQRDEPPADGAESGAPPR